MNKAELIAAVAKKTGLPKKDTETAINTAFHLIIASLGAGDKVQLVGFGVFDVKRREPRVGRNPRTNEAIQIAASRTPFFKPGKVLKEAVAGVPAGDGEEAF